MPERLEPLGAAPMADRVFDCSAVVARRLMERAAAIGKLSPEALVENLGLVDARSDPEGRVPLERLAATWFEAAKRAKDPTIAISVARAVEIADGDVFGYLMATSASSLEALQVLVQYFPIVVSGPDFSVALRGERSHIVYMVPTQWAERYRHDAESLMAIIVRLWRLLFDPEWKPVAVSLQHSRPADVSAYVDWFGTEPEFNATATELVFDGRAEEHYERPRDDALHDILRRYAKRLLSAERGSWMQRYRRELIAAFPHRAHDLESLAKRMGTSVRTLQRRLQEHDTSHEESVRVTRRLLAEHYLQDGAFAVKEIAFLLGFATPNSFHRAFRTWTGMTPGDYRERYTRSIIVQ